MKRKILVFCFIILGVFVCSLNLNAFTIKNEYSQEIEIIDYNDNIINIDLYNFDGLQDNMNLFYVIDFSFIPYVSDYNGDFGGINDPNLFILYRGNDKTIYYEFDYQSNLIYWWIRSTSDFSLDSFYSHSFDNNSKLISVCYYDSGNFVIEFCYIYNGNIYPLDFIQSYVHFINGSYSFSSPFYIMFRYYENSHGINFAYLNYNNLYNNDIYTLFSFNGDIIYQVKNSFNQVNYNEGYNNGYAQGYYDGVNGNKVSEMLANEYNKGYNEGVEYTSAIQYDEGYNNGRVDGERDGYRIGFDEGNRTANTLNIKLTYLISESFNGIFTGMMPILEYKLFGISIMDVISLIGILALGLIILKLFI